MKMISVHMKMRMEKYLKIRLLMTALFRHLHAIMKTIERSSFLCWKESKSNYRAERKKNGDIHMRQSSVSAKNFRYNIQNG